MNNVQQNVASEIQKISSELLSIKARLSSITLMYANEGLAALTTEELAALAELAHVTASEFQSKNAALSEINTALGDYTPTSNVAKLLKIVSGVPK